MAEEELDALTGAGSAGSEEEDPLQRLSLGQRIAGMKDPAVAPPDAAPVVRPQFDPNAIPEAIRPRALTPQEIPQPPSPSQNSALVPLVKQQAQLSKPISPMDETTGKIKPEYRMGTGQRILGTAANFLQGFGRKPFTPVPVGPGATNWKFGREESQREKELAGVDKQIGTQEKFSDENEKLYRDATRQAYEGQLGEARQQAAAATEQRADVAAQLADIKQQATKNQFDEAKAKLDQMAKKAETDANLRQQLIDNQRAMTDLRSQIAQGQLDQKQKEMESKYGTGATEKSLEDERKARLTAIENDWKEHPYWNKLTGNKTKEIQTVNDDINGRLTQLQRGGVGKSGQPGQSTSPAPQTHIWSRSAWQKANPKGDVKAAERQAKAKGFQVNN